MPARDTLLHRAQGFEAVHERLTGALLDRLTHHVQMLDMNVDSCRLTESKGRQRSPPEAASPEMIGLQSGARYGAPGCHHP